MSNKSKLYAGIVLLVIGIILITLEVGNEVANVDVSNADYSFNFGLYIV